MSCKRILIIDKNSITKEQSFQISSHIENATIIIAANVNEGMQKAHTEQPDIIVYVLNSRPNQEDINILNKLKNVLNIPVIFITNQTNDSIQEAMELNSDAILVKPYTTIQLIVSIKRVLNHFERNHNLIINKTLDKSSKYNRSMPKPSVREMEVVRQLAKGGTSQLIADELCISSTTVQTHRKNLLNKYKARSCAELINIACRNNWLEIAG